VIPLILVASQRSLDPLDDVKLKGALVAAMVTDMDGKVLYQRNADLRVMPASNQKLLSCAFALAKKGEARPVTQFWFGEGAVTVAAEGDPTLSIDQFKSFQDRISPLSVSKVRLWQAYQSERPDTWQIGDAPNRYGPAVHAFSIDRAGFELWITPKGADFRPHRPVFDRLETDFDKGSFVAYYSPLASFMRLTGELPRTEKKIDTYSDPHPAQTACANLIGVEKPDIEVLKDRPDTAPDAEITGPPMSELIKLCLQPSDNLIAEHLLMHGAGVGSHRIATQNLSKWLESTVGWEPKSYNVADGSGLSRKNNVTTRNIAKLLKWSHQQPTKNVWMKALAAGGQKGTLANRLKTVGFVGKTGTLDMVSALSGYVKCSNGQTKIVSVVLNHYGCSTGEAQQIIDRFIENVSN
jgi:serine-type D-Ala-D-Ala carboxypeptidase/endopeptidase (penicillin-binding protein 4)